MPVAWKTYASCFGNSHKPTTITKHTSLKKCGSQILTYLCNIFVCTYVHKSFVLNAKPMFLQFIFCKVDSKQKSHIQRFINRFVFFVLLNQKIRNSPSFIKFKISAKKNSCKILWRGQDIRNFYTFVNLVLAFSFSEVTSKQFRLHI